MGQKSIKVFYVSLIFNLVFCGIAFSTCFETAGRKLQPGSIARYIPQILRSYENDVPNGAIYTVQKNQGHYFKICNEPIQVRHFMEKWAYSEVPKGDWKSLLTTRDKSKIDVIKEIGVFKIQKEGKTWNIWKFAEKEEAKVRLFVETDPSSARVRVLNIKPKFYQGIELIPGRYHVEVSADGFKKENKWLTIKKNQEEKIYVTLKKALPIQNARMENDNKLSLFRAIEAGNIKEVESMVRSGVDVNSVNKTGETPLMNAALRGHYEIVEFLISEGAVVTQKDKTGCSALNKAAAFGRLRIAKLLVANGADVNEKTMHGNTALTISVLNKNDKMVEFLVSKGADVNLKDSDEGSPLMYASYQGYIDIVKFLLNKGADVNLEGKNGWTALRYSKMNGHTIVVSLLKEYGAK